MVARACRRAYSAVASDLQAFSRQVRAAFGRSRTAPGLYPYRVRSGGGERRLHLRVHDDGSGLLFVDVSHAVHLSPTAAEVARMLLDGIDERRAVRQMRAWYPSAPRGELEVEAQRVASAVESLKQPSEGCPTCLPELVRTPVFSERAQAPYKADLALTYACNNDCAHCYNEAGRKGLASLDLDGWREVLTTLAGLGVPHIILTGGEPTLHEDLPQLIEHAEAVGQVTGVNTNGRRLSEPGFAEALKRAGLDHVQITLASHRPEVHDRMVRARAHEETVAGIEAALAADLHTITNTTLTRDTRDDALETIDFIHSLGVRTFAMNGMICSGGGKANPSALPEAELVPILGEVTQRAGELGMRFLWYTPTEYCRLSPVELGLGPKACNAAEYSICIEPDGAVLPCQSYYEPVGNIVTDDWDDIWHSPLFEAIRNRREDPVGGGLPERCHECDELPTCGGGCPLRRAERRKEIPCHAG